MQRPNASNPKKIGELGVFMILRQIGWSLSHYKLPRNVPFISTWTRLTRPLVSSWVMWAGRVPSIQNPQNKNRPKNIEIWTPSTSKDFCNNPRSERVLSRTYRTFLVVLQLHPYLTPLRMKQCPVEWYSNQETQNQRISPD